MMGSVTTVTCDQCNEDLTYTGNCQDYRLVLGYESKTGQGPTRTLVAIRPPVDRTYIFCGLPCLHMWMQENHKNLSEAYEKLQKHRAWLAQSQAPKAR